MSHQHNRSRCVGRRRSKRGRKSTSNGWIKCMRIQSSAESRIEGEPNRRNYAFLSSSTEGCRLWVVSEGNRMRRAFQLIWIRARRRKKNFLLLVPSRKIRIYYGCKWKVGHAMPGKLLDFVNKLLESLSIKSPSYCGALSQSDFSSRTEKLISNFFPSSFLLLFEKRF